MLLFHFPSIFIPWFLISTRSVFVIIVCVFCSSKERTASLLSKSSVANRSSSKIVGVSCVAFLMVWYSASFIKTREILCSPCEPKSRISFWLYNTAGLSVWGPMDVCQYKISFCLLFFRFLKMVSRV